MKFENVYQLLDGKWARKPGNEPIYLSVEEILPNLYVAEDIDHYWFFINPITGDQQQPIMCQRPIVPDQSTKSIVVYPLLKIK